jgi:hypothetical protein
VAQGGLLDHLPVLLQIENVGRRLPAPFKFDHSESTKGDFRGLIIGGWKYYDDNNEDSTFKQFIDNLKRVNGENFEWAQNYAKKKQKELNVDIMVATGGIYLHM